MKVLETSYLIFHPEDGSYCSWGTEKLKNIVDFLDKDLPKHGYKLWKKIKGNTMEMKALDKNGTGAVMPKRIENKIYSTGLGILEIAKVGGFTYGDLKKIQKRVFKRGKMIGQIGTVEDGHEIYMHSGQRILFLKDPKKRKV
jgi:hypothetical protein